MASSVLVQADVVIQEAAMSPASPAGGTGLAAAFAALLADLLPQGSLPAAQPSAAPSVPAGALLPAPSAQDTGASKDDIAKTALTLVGTDTTAPTALPATVTKSSPGNGPDGKSEPRTKRGDRSDPASQANSTVSPSVRLLRLLPDILLIPPGDRGPGNGSAAASGEPTSPPLTAANPLAQPDRLPAGGTAQAKMPGETSAVGRRTKSDGTPKESPAAARSVAASDDSPTKRDGLEPIAPAIAAVQDIKPEQAPIRTDALSDLAILAARPDPPHGLLSDTTSPPRQADAAQATTGDRTGPGDQVAPALVGMLKSADGTQSVTVRLQPAELGQVQIRVDRTAEGAAHVGITADRPETLQLLQRDLPRLEQALDQAGILSSGRSVSFLATSPEPVGASASRPDSMDAGFGSFGQGQSGGTWRGSEDARRDTGNGPGPEQGQGRTRWIRAGLDITA